MLYTYVVQIDPIPVNSDDPVNQILVWIIGVLIGTIIIVYAYFKADRMELKKELKELRAYVMTQNVKNTELITSVDILLSRQVQELDKNNEHLHNVKGHISDVKQTSELMRAIMAENKIRMEEILKQVYKLGKNAEQ